MISMQCFLMYALLEDTSDRNVNGFVFHLVYYPLFVCCFVFSIKQIDSEIKQLNRLKLDKYLTLWNLVDVTYIALNILIMLMNFKDVMVLDFGDSGGDGKIKLFTLSWLFNPNEGSIHL